MAGFYSAPQPQNAAALWPTIAPPRTAGLIAVSALLLWQAAERLLHPEPVIGLVPIVVGIVAAAGNWGVAHLLLAPSRKNAAIRLAYVHNIGDVWISLAPVAAGVLLSLTGRPSFDPLIGGGVAIWFIVSTGREVLISHEELIWPEKIVCGHADYEQPQPRPQISN